MIAYVIVQIEKHPDSFFNIVAVVLDDENLAEKVCNQFESNPENKHYYFTIRECHNVVPVTNET